MGVPICEEALEKWVSYFSVIGGSYAVSGRFDVDDCVQECCVELTLLLEEMDPTDIDFAAALKTRIFRRMIDLQREAFRPTHDVRREQPVPDEVRETCIDPNPGLDPVAVAHAHDVAHLIEKRLTAGPQLMLWHEIVAPSLELGRCFTNYRHRVKRERKSLPMGVYAEVLQLSERQCRHALRRIQDAAQEVLLTEGLNYAGAFA